MAISSISASRPEPNIYRQIRSILSHAEVSTNIQTSPWHLGYKLRWLPVLIHPGNFLANGGFLTSKPASIDEVEHEGFHGLTGLQLRNSLPGSSIALKQELEDFHENISLNALSVVSVPALPRSGSVFCSDIDQHRDRTTYYAGL
jgi:hypothetical protein